MCTGAGGRTAPAVCHSRGSGHPSPHALSVWLYKPVPPSARTQDGSRLAAPGAPRARNPTEPLGVRLPPHPDGNSLPRRSAPAPLSSPGQARRAASSATLTGHRACLEVRHAGPTLFCSPVCLSGESTARATDSWLCPPDGSRDRAPHRDLQLGLNPRPRTGLPSPLPSLCGSQLGQPQRHARGIPGRQLEGFCPSEPEH